MCATTILRDFTLEGFDFGSQDESLRFKDAIDRCADFIANGGVLSCQIEKRNRFHAR